MLISVKLPQILNLHICFSSFLAPCSQLGCTRTCWLPLPQARSPIPPRGAPGLLTGRRASPGCSCEMSCVGTGLWEVGLPPWPASSLGAQAECWAQCWPELWSAMPVPGYPHVCQATPTCAKPSLSPSPWPCPALQGCLPLVTAWRVQVLPTSPSYPWCHASWLPCPLCCCPTHNHITPHSREAQKSRQKMKDSTNPGVFRKCSSLGKCCDCQRGETATKTWFCWSRAN